MTHMLTALALAVVLTTGCDSGKKDAAAGAEGKAAAGKAAVEAKKEAVTCKQGELLDGDECVAVLTPQKVEAVGKQVTKFEELEKKLDEIESLTAVVGVMDSLRQLDAWKTATKTSDKFAKADEMIETLRAGAEAFKNFNTQVKETKAKLADLETTLKGIYDGSGAAKSVEDARTKVSTELRAAVEPLQAQVAAALEAIEPVLGELSKLKDITTGICAMGSIYGAGEDFTTACNTGKDAFGKAVTFLESHKDAPKVLLVDLVGMLDKQLSGLVDEQTKALLTKAQATVDEATGAESKTGE